MERPLDRREPSDIGLREREKPLIKDLNQHIICPLCKGYLIDATTLVECLHSFCRGCIIQRLNVGPRSCPVCKTAAIAPLVADVGLQRLVYLVVPGLFRSEQERRRHFCQANPQCLGLGQPPLGAPDLGFDDLVSLSLCELEAQPETSPRYLKCPAGVTVRHLLRLLTLKRGWDDNNPEDQQRLNSKIEMMYEVGSAGNDDKREHEILDSSWTLMDLACIFEWKREAPMNLLYRVTRTNESTTSKAPKNHISNSSVETVSTTSTTTNTDTSNQVIENIPRPPTPPPSPKLAISRSDALEKNVRPSPTTTTTVVEQYSNLKDLESKKPRCEVTPVMRAPDPPPINENTKSRKPQKLEHKRKRRRNKRVIAEITTTPREDLLKLKVRLTPCPPRVTSSSADGNQSKDKLLEMRTVRKEKTKSVNSEKQRFTKERRSTPPIEEDKQESIAEPIVDKPEPVVAVEKSNVIEAPILPPGRVQLKEQPEKEETPKNEEVLRKLGLVAISEANKTRREGTKSPARSSGDKPDPEIEREKLEKQLRESKANRVRSLLAEKQMRDTLKSIMSNSKEVSLISTSRPSSSSITSVSRSGTPTTGSAKRKEPPPLTPLRSTKRSSVTFSLNSFSTGKYESPLDLSSPSHASKDNVLDLSAGVTLAKIQEKPVGILRTSKPPLEKPKEENKKTQDLNLRTLSDAAVSLLDDRSPSANKLSKLPQALAIGAGGSNITGKVALRIPQPHQRITGFGMKIKPNIGVRHIPNPQAVVASQYRNQRNEYFNISHQPP